MKTKHNNPLVKGKSSQIAPLFLSILFASYSLAYSGGLGVVKNVVSGDTVEISDFVNPRKTFTTHINGIDAPEPGQPFFNESKTFLEKLILGRTVKNTDSGLFCEGAPVHEIMVEQGYAWVYKDNIKNDSYTRNKLVSGESKARTDKKGLWATGNPVSPGEYRRSEEERKHDERSKRQLLAYELDRKARVKAEEQERQDLEKYETAQIAKGLVKYMDFWLTPEQRDQYIEKIRKKRVAEEETRIERAREAERQRLAQIQYEVEQTAKGLIKYNGNWVTPEQKHLAEESLVKAKQDQKIVHPPKGPSTVASRIPVSGPSLASTGMRVAPITRSQEWQELHLDHFRIFHKGCSELADKTGKYLEDRFKAMTKKLDIVTGLDLLWYGQNSVKLYIYPSQQELVEELKLPKWAAGCANYETRTIYSIEDEDDIKRIVTHELGHLLFADMINKKFIIGWIDEGMARWLEPEEGRAARKQSLAAAKQKNSLLSLNELTSMRNYQALSSTKAQFFYAQSERLIDVLMQASDFVTFQGFCIHIQNGSDFATAFAIFYSPKFRTLEGLNQAWLDSM
ncbi:MAG: hypothetical protein A2283_17760 [Lentisphaerae bacterium RIFOXYA12_FULL_48_11]|nr:MAG: hypothetical protein A2283_17760 [Lentisphaerae bacterium RIFOXYA12_FULL_48_11]